MKANKQEKLAARALAEATGVNYTEALRATRASRSDTLPVQRAIVDAIAKVRHVILELPDDYPIELLVADKLAQGPDRRRQIVVITAAVLRYHFIATAQDLGIADIFVWTPRMFRNAAPSPDAVVVVCIDHLTSREGTSAMAGLLRTASAVIARTYTPLVGVGKRIVELGIEEYPLLRVPSWGPTAAAKAADMVAAIHAGDRSVEVAADDPSVRQSLRERGPASEIVRVEIQQAPQPLEQALLARMPKAEPSTSTSTSTSESYLDKVWLATDDFRYGVDAPADADPDAILEAFLAEAEGLSLELLTEDEIASLHKALGFYEMRSVLKSDVECGDVGDAEPGEFHTGGTGQRRSDIWAVESVPFNEVVDAVVDRLQSECEHAALTNWGTCPDCGASKRRIAELASKV